MNNLDHQPSYMLVTIAAAFCTAWIIISGSGVVPLHPMDQAFAYVDLSISRTGGYWKFEYPRLQWAGGVTASLTVGLYKLLFAPSIETLNWHVRILGAALYLASAMLLVRAFVESAALGALALVVIGSSGFQLLEPTSELIAAGYLCLVLVGVKRAWPDWSVAALLVLFGLCKVELALAAALAGAFWAGRAPRRFAWLLLFVSVLLAPGFVVHGLDVVSGGRAMEALRQHYSMLSPAAAERLADIHGVREFVFRHPIWYIDFLILSAGESAANILFAVKGLLVVSLMASWRKVAPEQVWRIFAILMVVSLLPAMLVAFVHVRYMARFFPAIVVLACVCIDGMKIGDTRRNVAIGAVLLTIAAQLWFAPALISNPHGY